MVANQEANSSIAIEIAGTTGEMVAPPLFQGTCCKGSPACLFQVNNRINFFVRIIADYCRRLIADGHDVFAAAALEICSDRAHGAVHIRQMMMLKREHPLVLQPPDAMLRAQNATVERVAVGVDHIEITVAIQVDQLNAAGAVRGMGSGIDRFFAKLTSSLVQKGNDGLVFLADQGHKIGPAVLIKI